MKRPRRALLWGAALLGLLMALAAGPPAAQAAFPLVRQAKAGEAEAWGRDVRVQPDGNLMVLATVHTTGDDYVAKVIVLDPSGKLLFERDLAKWYNTDHWVNGPGWAFLAEGGLAIVGRVWEPQDKQQVRVLRLGSDGETVWEQELSVPASLESIARVLGPEPQPAAYAGVTKLKSMSVSRIVETPDGSLVVGGEWEQERWRGLQGPMHEFSRIVWVLRPDGSERMRTPLTSSGVPTLFRGDQGGYFAGTDSNQGGAIVSVYRDSPAPVQRDFVTIPELPAADPERRITASRVQFVLPRPGGGYLVAGKSNYTAKTTPTRAGGEAAAAWVVAVDAQGRDQWSHVGISTEWVAGAIDFIPASRDGTILLERISMDQRRVVRLGPRGDVRWSLDLGGTRLPTRPLHILPGGDILVNVASRGVPEVVRLHDDGQVVWRSKVGSPRGASLLAVEPAPDGGFVATGNVGKRILVVKLNREGR